MLGGFYLQKKRKNIRYFVEFREKIGKEYFADFGGSKFLGKNIAFLIEPLSTGLKNKEDY
jgi:hypothetical protein